MDNDDDDIHRHNRPRRPLSAARHLIPGHPPYFEMIAAALRSSPSTEQAISDYIVASFPDLPSAHSSLLHYYLNKLLSSHHLLSPSPGLYSLPSSPPSSDSTPPAPRSRVRRRGRPRKNSSFETDPAPVLSLPPPAPRGRGPGRPRKNSNEFDAVKAPRRRGRPRKNPAGSRVPRGRPPKDGFKPVAELARPRLVIRLKKKRVETVAEKITATGDNVGCEMSGNGDVLGNWVVVKGGSEMSVEYESDEEALILDPMLETLEEELCWQTRPEAKLLLPVEMGQGVCGDDMLDEGFRSSGLSSEIVDDEASLPSEVDKLGIGEGSIDLQEDKGMEHDVGSMQAVSELDEELESVQFVDEAMKFSAAGESFGLADEFMMEFTETLEGETVENDEAEPCEYLSQTFVLDDKSMLSKESELLIPMVDAELPVPRTLLNSMSIRSFREQKETSFSTWLQNPVQEQFDIKEELALRSHVQLTEAIEQPQTKQPNLDEIPLLSHDPFNEASFSYHQPDMKEELPFPALFEEDFKNVKCLEFENPMVTELLLHHSAFAL